MIFLSVWVEGILQLFTNFYLQRKVLIFLRNDCDFKVVQCKKEISRIRKFGSYEKYTLVIELFSVK